jgi:tRNA A37 threonylcarbamoyladenosine dehydratase
MEHEFNSEDYNQRFGGIARLYGVQGLKNLLNARVLIVGLGGVGSWAAESLARSGVGAITLVDLDDICITNTNRQLPAMSGQYGKLKVAVVKERILAINPQCHVHAIEDFFTETTSAAILDNHFDYVIDAIDSLKNKCVLASLCKERNLPIIITGGAAGKINPAEITLADLGESINDSLLFRMRKRLRQEFNFPNASKSTPTKRQKFHMMCVYSPEEPVYPTSDGGTCSVPDSETNLKLDCESGMGSVSHITALFGFMAAGHVINTIAKK